MSFASRLKARREQLGITQVQLAEKLGVTKGAIGNYEAGISSPRADILYQVFNALHCDANYLFRDEMEEQLYRQTVTIEEMQHIKKYRLLNEAGKKKTDEYMEILLGNEDFKKGEKVLEVVARSGDHLKVPDNGALDDMVVSYPDDL